MTTTNKITKPDEMIKYLDQLGIKTNTIVHRPVFTVAEGQDVKAQIPGAHCKNLFVKDKKGKLFLITAKDHTPINLKKTHEVIGGSGRLSFCTEEQMWEYLAVRPGSVTPLSIMNDVSNKVTMILDIHLMKHNIFNCHPMLNTHTTSMNIKDLIFFLKSCNHEPLIVTLPEPPPVEDQ